jgi:hypothetical protein
MADAQHAATRRRSPGHPASAGLFPHEEEVARRLSQTPRDWAAKAIILERDGLPKVDPIMGGRFWPAVQAYWCRRYGLTSMEVSNPDGGENLDAL